LGSTRDILVGEYNVFILSLEVLRQRLVTDMTYIKQVDVGLLIVSFSAQLWFRSGSLNVEITEKAARRRFPYPATSRI